MELVNFVRHPGHKRPGSIRLLDNSTRLQQSYILRHSLVSPSCKSGCLSHTSPELASCVRHFALQRQAGCVLAIALLSLATQSHCFVSFRSSRVRSTATRARQAVLRCPVVSFPPRAYAASPGVSPMRSHGPGSVTSASHFASPWHRTIISSRYHAAKFCSLAA
jgi:hypothetical protein